MSSNADLAKLEECDSQALTRHMASNHDTKAAKLARTTTQTSSNGKSELVADQNINGDSGVRDG